MCGQKNCAVYAMSSPVCIYQHTHIDSQLWTLKVSNQRDSPVPRDVCDVCAVSSLRDIYADICTTSTVQYLCLIKNYCTMNLMLLLIFSLNILHLKTLKSTLMRYNLHTIK